MRVSVPALLCPFRQLTSAHRIANTASLWRLYSTSSRSKDSAVFPNDLQKTLAAHRMSNRVSVIRKVVPGSESPDESSGVARPLEKTSHESSDEPLSFKAPSTAKILLGQLDRHAHRPQSKKRTSSKRRYRPSPTTPSSVISRLASPKETGRWSWNETCPWLRHADLRAESSDAITRLDAEIKSLERYMIPTPREHARVDNVVSDVTRLVADIVSQSPQVVGSWRTGFASSHSNLDLLLPVGHDKPSDISSGSLPHGIESHLELLQRVAAALEQSADFTQCELISRGTPTITAVHHPIDLRIQLHCGQRCHSLAEYIQNYHAEYPALRPLYMATRVVLEAQDAYGANAASIDSTALVMLLVAFLKLNHGRFQRPDSLGEQLLAFLELYGTGLQLGSTGVSVDPPGFFDADIKDETTSDTSALPAHLRGQLSLMNAKRTAKRRHNHPLARRLCIQDPSNYMKDLGGWCTRTGQLQRTFAAAHDRLRASLESWGESGHDTPRSVLFPVLQANFDEFQKRRLRLAFSSD